MLKLKRDLRLVGMTEKLLEVQQSLPKGVHDPAGHLPDLTSRWFSSPGNEEGQLPSLQVTFPQGQSMNIPNVANWSFSWMSGAGNMPCTNFKDFSPSTFVVKSGWCEFALSKCWGRIYVLCLIQLPPTVVQADFSYLRGHRGMETSGHFVYFCCISSTISPASCLQRLFIKDVVTNLLSFQLSCLVETELSLGKWMYILWSFNFCLGF